MNPAATTIDPATAARCRAFARGAGLVAAMAGGFVLVGWALDLDWLKSVFPGGATIKPNAAVGFMLSGAALGLLGEGQDRRLAIARLCAALAATLGWLTLAEYLLGLNLGFDDLLFHAGVHNSTDLHPGRMAPATALSFSLLGVTLLARDARGRFSVYLADSLALATALVGLLALLGYIFGVKSLYQIAAYSSMALHTAVLFFMLGLGALAVRPAAGVMAIITTENDGGRIARRILPLTVVLPLFFGWLGLQGERAGSYGPEFGLAIVALSNIAAFALLVLIGARELNQLGASRRESEAKFLTSFRSSTVGFSITTPEGKFVDVNDAFCEIIGYSRAETLGRSSTDLGLLSVPNRDRLIAALLANGGSARNAEVQFRVKGGQMRDILYSVGPILLNGVQHRLATGIDVTERKQAEQALCEREQQLRLFVEYCPAAVAMCDRDMKYLVVSRRWASDYHLGKQDIVGRNHYEVFPDLAERWKEIHQRCFAGAVEKCNEDSFTLADGTTVWFRWEARPWHDAQGGVGGIIMFSEGITARKRAEGRLRRLVDSNVQGVIFWNKLGEITQANDAFLRLVGYTRADLVAGLISWAAMTPPEYAQLDRHALAELAATGVCTPYEKDYIRKDGSRVSVLIGAASFEDNPGEGVCFVLDITTRKRAEDTLRQSEQSFRAFVSASSDVIYRMSANWNVMHQLDGRGFIVDTIKPRDTWFQEYIFPDDQSRVMAVINEAIRTKGKFELEHRVRRVDGTVGWTFSRAIPLHDAKGEIVEWLGAASDVTERKHAETALLAAHEQQRVLSRRLLEIQETERRQIARDLHDELGQILTALKINLQTIQPAAVGPLAPSVALVDRALQQTRSLSLALRPPLLDDLGLVPALRWLVDQQARKAGCRITLAVEPLPDRPGPAVETACFRIAQEAVTNAQRHARANLIAVELRLVGDELQLTVRDDGTGFDLVAARTQALRGGSLGVLGMEERATLAGGRMGWDSAAGSGTTVQATFPLSPAPAVDEDSAV